MLDPTTSTRKGRHLMTTPAITAAAASTAKSVNRRR